jgi:hypothetical protein
MCTFLVYPIAVFYNAACETQGKSKDAPDSIDWAQAPASLGFTLELCAGIMDKKHLSAQETAKEEVLEECGYDVPLEKFEPIKRLRLAY